MPEEFFEQPGDGAEDDLRATDLGHRAAPLGTRGNPSAENRTGTAVNTADRAIRVSTMAAVLGVAGVAAYVSYWHAYEVVRAHGGTGITARVEPATIDGLVYCSSMVVLYAAGHQLPVPALARWLLGLGIVATLAANVAHGWSHGAIGAAVAAWPATGLVGSYELLLWLIRSAAAGSPVRGPVADQTGGPTNQPTGLAEHRTAELRLAPKLDQDVPEHQGAANDAAPSTGLDGYSRDPVGTAARASGPDWTGPGQEDRYADQEATRWPTADGPAGSPNDMDAAAVAAYRTSLDNGAPLSERKLAAMFGKTSRRWARNRMAEARTRTVTAVIDTA
jgi:hypothetical protein